MLPEKFTWHQLISRVEIEKGQGKRKYCASVVMKRKLSHCGYFCRMDEKLSPFEKNSKILKN